MFKFKLNEIYEIIASNVWYHGRKVHATEFNLDKTGNGNDESGPGFYFSSDLKDAASYAYPNGIVIKAELNLRKLTPEKPNKLDIHTLIRAAPNLADTLTNWDENPNKAFKQAFDVIMKVDDPYQQVWIDFYKHYPAEYLKNMMQLGYDGHESKMPKSVRHMVVYNPKAIKMLEVIPYGET